VLPGADRSRQTSLAGRPVDLRLLAVLKPEWTVSMDSLVFDAKRSEFLNETQAQYIWKQFNIHLCAAGTRLPSGRAPYPKC
jgi:hypothetical protein